MELRDYYGCRETVFLRPMAGNATPHVDMFMTFAAPDVILLGQFRPEQDRLNHRILEESARRLASLSTSDGRPFTIRRVPMPDPVELFEDDPDGPVVRSYLNLLVYNDVVLVPTYVENPVEEELALSIIQQAFPERFVLPVPADALALDGGTIHCITRTFPIDVQSAS
jgi:agmatine deiminase